MKKRFYPFSLYFFLLLACPTFSPVNVAGASFFSTFKTICLSYLMISPMQNTHVKGIESTLQNFDGPPYHYYEGIDKASDGYFAGGISRSQGQQNKLVSVDYDHEFNINWIGYFGSSGRNDGKDSTIAINGDRLVCGDTSQYGQGNYDIAIVRYSPTGNLTWAKTMGTNRRENCNGIAPTSDNGCAIVGYASDRTYSSSSRDMLVAKLDASGNATWTTILSTSRNFYGKAVTESRDGHIVALGDGRYPSTYHIIIAKFDGTNGTLIWKRNIPWSSNQIAQGIIATEDGGVLVQGYGYRYDSAFSFSLNTVYAEINSTGGLQYMYALGDTINTYYYGQDIKFGLNNTFAITGYSVKSNLYNPFLALFDVHDGNLTLAKRVVSNQRDQIRALVGDQNGDFVTVGYTKRGASSFYYNGLLLKWQSDNVSSDCSEAFELKRIDLSSIDYDDASFLTAALIPYTTVTIPSPDYTLDTYTNQTKHCLITLPPSQSPTHSPTPVPTSSPTQEPTLLPTTSPTQEPTQAPTQDPTFIPTHSPSQRPSKAPTTLPTNQPTNITQEPTENPAGRLEGNNNDCILGTDPQRCISSKEVVAIIFVVPIILIGAPLVGWAVFRRLKP